MTRPMGGKARLPGSLAFSARGGGRQGRPQACGDKKTLEIQRLAHSARRCALLFERRDAQKNIYRL